MTKFKRIELYTTHDAPKDKVIYVFVDQDGWFYLKKLVEVEGLATPFSSIEEIELYTELKLTKLNEYTPK